MSTTNESRVDTGKPRDFWGLTNDDYEIIKVWKELIPKSGKLVEAYETEHEIIVMGTPEDEPEGLTKEQMDDWYEKSHNCDAMGCGSLSHVIYRFCK